MRCFDGEMHSTPSEGAAYALIMVDEAIFLVISRCKLLSKLNSIRHR